MTAPARGEPDPVATPDDRQAAAVAAGQDTLAGFYPAALAWAAGNGPVPCWQSWANRLALTWGDLIAALQTPPASGGPGELGGPA